MKASQEINVLVVDDAPFNREILMRQATMFAHVHVTCAGSAREATALLKEARVDLIFLDLNLPDDDGLSLYLRLKKKSLIPAACRVYALTATTDQETCKNCLQAGMSGFLSKPISSAALQDVLLSPDTTAMGKPQGVVPPSLQTPQDSRPAFHQEKGELLNRRRLDELLHMANGDAAFLAQCANVFLDDTKATMAALEQALQSEQGDLVFRLAHRLAGYCRNIGADRLAADCESIGTFNCDSTNRHRNASTTAAQFEDLSRLYQDTCSALKSLVDSPGVCGSPRAG